MLVLKNSRRQFHDDIKKKFEGGHFMNTNWFVQTMIGIHQKVYKAIQLSRSYPPTPQKNIKRLLRKEDCDGTLSFL
jgi:hypothetical protein